MGDYRFNGKLISTWGISAIRKNESPIALSGAWDMPARIGKTFHDWGADGIEPYVRTSEILFGGRDLELSCAMVGFDRLDVLAKCKSMYSEFAALSTLSHDVYGSYNVYIKGKIQVDYKIDGIALLTIPLREPVVTVVGAVPGASNAGIGIDGISFDQLGLIPISTTGQYNRAAPKSGEFTAYRNEGYKITSVGAREIEMRFALLATNYNEFASRVSAVQMLFKKEGLRYITKDNDALRTFFIKDGFKITIKQTDPQFVAYLDIKITEVEAYTDWSFLTDSNGPITDNNAQKIITI